MNKILLSLLIITFLSSCTHYKGIWDDNIHLSAKTAEFNSSTDSVIINTKGTSWWISDISVDSINYFDFHAINQISGKYKIKLADILLDRRDRNTLFIKVEANPLNRARIIKIGFEAGDYFDSVTITQKGE